MLLTLSQFSKCNYDVLKVPAPKRGEVVRQIAVAIREKLQPLGRLVSLVHVCICDGVLFNTFSFRLRLAKSMLRVLARSKSTLTCVILPLDCPACSVEK